MEEEAGLPTIIGKEEEAELPTLKQSLCRFYLRGLCSKTAEECEFAHGIEDLLYRPWREGQHVEYDFQGETLFCQKQSPSPTKNYINIYQSQQDLAYSLEEINCNREVRLQLRSLFHQAEFRKFVKLLQEEFDGVLWTEDVLLREYTRVGFNKLMTRIHFSHLTSFLLGGESPLYFKSSLLMPPNTRRQAVFYIKRATDEEITLRYKEAYEDILANHTQLTLEELKRKLISYPLGNVGIPSLPIYLKQKNITLDELLGVLGQGKLTKIEIKETQQPTFEALLAEAKRYIMQYGRSRVIVWKRVAHHLCQTFGIAKLKREIDLKTGLSLEGYFYFHLPFMSFLYHISLGSQLQERKEIQCPCSLQEVYELEFAASLCPAKDGEVFDIDSASELSRLAPLFLSSSVVAVDLEGQLRRGGVVEMIQISNSKNIFLIDLLTMANNNDFTSIQYTKRVLRNLMAGPVVKVFHDCRQDSLALHELLQTCVLNVFDTSAMETVEAQHERLRRALLLEQQGERRTRMKQAVQFCQASKAPSLNHILTKYSSSHGPNSLKDHFHSQWQSGKSDSSQRRPLSPRFRAYCIMDVIDLVEIYHKMVKEVSPAVLAVGRWLSSIYAKAGHVKEGCKGEWQAGK